MEVIAEAGSGEEAVRLALGVAPDVVLMDFRFVRGDHCIDGMKPYASSPSKHRKHRW
ncbi:hypothetical protein ABT373_37325 [Streptomyces sp. NPDC000070]|uniref:hypothetical protein n=1 Tax=Streptomyces sp. NPDC000070 TaxID=3154240 RepID=UPI00332F0E84